MLYTDKEQLDWWAARSKAEQAELLQNMFDRAPSPGFRSFAEDLRRCYEADVTLSPRQVGAIRKWEK